MSKFNEYIEMAISAKRVYPNSSLPKWNILVDKIEDAIDDEIKLKLHKQNEKEITVKLEIFKLFGLLQSHTPKDKQVKDLDAYNKYFDKINNELKKRYIKNGWSDLKAEDYENGVNYTLIK